jgi:hypothetical protein
MNAYSKILTLLPKWWSIVIWILAVILLCGNRLNSQTYVVGDTIDNFSAPICVNGDGEWNYDVDGYINVLDVIGLIQIIMGGNQQQALQYLESILDPIMFKELTQELIEIESPKLLVWPNPSNSVMNINGYGYVQIYNMLGKEVYENHLNGHHIWDTRNLPSGIYHIFNNGETTTVTLLK